MEITDEMVKAGAAAICCRAKELGCAAKHENTEFATCMLGTFVDDARRCFETIAPAISRLTAEREGLRKALGFYADPFRYNGPNQLLADDETDPWNPDGVYLQDVTRDGGSIARRALATTSESAEGEA